MFIYRQKFRRFDNLPVFIPVLIDSDRIVFEVIVSNAKPNWYRSGTLTRTILINGIGFVFEEAKTMAIGKKLIDYEPQGKYRVEFTPYSWITDYQISIWKLPSNLQLEPSQIDQQDYLLGLI